MKRMIKKKYVKNKSTSNNKVQLTKHIFISKVSGQEQHRIWKPRVLKETSLVGQQHVGMSAQLQHKVRDPRGFIN